MEADWSMELGASAPSLELPWHDPEGRWQYVDLGQVKLGPEAGPVEKNAGNDAENEAGNDALRHLTRDIDHNLDHNIDRNVDRIPEAHLFPALRRFLLQANAAQSPWQTVKCSAWAEETAPEENLYDAGYMQSSYVDVVLAGTAAGQRNCLETHQRLATELAAIFAANEQLEAFADIVVRRCYFHHKERPEQSDAGYCLTIFLIGYGTTEAAALECWSQTLGFAAECLLQLHCGEKCD